MDLTLLVARLNDVSRRTLEAAAGGALSRTHYNVEVEHWLLQLVDRAGSDVGCLVRSLGIDAGQVMDNLTASLDRLSTGNGRAPGLSPDIVRLMKDAWLFASIEQRQSTIRS